MKRRRSSMTMSCIENIVKSLVIKYHTQFTSQSLWMTIMMAINTIIIDVFNVTWQFMKRAQLYEKFWDGLFICLFTSHIKVENNSSRLESGHTSKRSNMVHSADHEAGFIKPVILWYQFINTIYIYILYQNINIWYLYNIALLSYFPKWFAYYYVTKLHLLWDSSDFCSVHDGTPMHQFDWKFGYLFQLKAHCTDRFQMRRHMPHMRHFLPHIFHR